MPKSKRTNQRTRGQASRGSRARKITARRKTSSRLGGQGAQRQGEIGMESRIPEQRGWEQE